MKTKKLTLLALLAAIALTIFMIEAQIPSPVPIPGVKLGLANIVTVFTVFVLGPKEGAAVLAVWVLLANLPFMVIQRYNRPRLVRLAALLRKREQKKGDTSARTDTDL